MFDVQAEIPKKHASGVDLLNAGVAGGHEPATVEVFDVLVVCFVDLLE